MRFCIVGAGFSGAVLAHQLVQAGHEAVVVDERPHVAGNCHTALDSETGVLVHVYGPHIFHTGDERVWEFIQRFGEMMPYNHRVQAVSGGRIFSLPINLLTINQFFNRTMSPSEAQSFIQSRAEPIAEPKNFEEQALSMIGAELYEAFFRGYTRKQWGLDPTKLPASILKRLPVRFDYNDSYFAHPHQAIPREGYTPIVERILSLDGITVRLESSYEEYEGHFDHLIYSGPIDRFFNYQLGRLGYRTLDFEVGRTSGDFQGTPVLNYCDESVPFTRVTEHKHFAPWDTSASGTLTYREFSRDCQPEDEPYYPIRLVDEQAMLNRYIDLAVEATNVSFVGRLGTYRYLDMDVTIGEALKAADRIIECIGAGNPIPSFFVNVAAK